MPIQSIKSGVLSRSTMVGNTLIYPGDFESIATATGTGSSGTITFNSIPSTYTHLQIRGIMRNSVAGTGFEYLAIRFNSDTGANYATHYVRTATDNSPVIVVSSLTSDTAINITACNLADNNLANAYGAAVIDILDYKNTNKYKTLKTLNGVDQNATNASNTGVNFQSGLWMSNNSITRIDLITNGNWKTNTTFALYGVN